jgi:hypothetical protein
MRRAIQIRRKLASCIFYNTATMPVALRDLSPIESIYPSSEGSTSVDSEEIRQLEEDARQINIQPMTFEQQIRTATRLVISSLERLNELSIEERRMPTALNAWLNAIRVMQSTLAALQDPGRGPLATSRAPRPTPTPVINGRELTESDTESEPDHLNLDADGDPIVNNPSARRGRRLRREGALNPIPATPTSPNELPDNYVPPYYR